MQLVKIRQWPIWRLPQQLLVPIALVELLACTLVAVDFVQSEIMQIVQGVPLSLLLLGGGIAHTEISLRIERTRRRFTQLGHVDLSSVWTFAAALALPLGAASVTVLMLYLYLFARVWRPAKVPAFKEVYSAATMLLALHAAVAVQQYVATASQGLWSPLSTVPLAAALVAYTVVNTCLVVGVVLLSSGRSLMQVLGEGSQIVLEIATLSLGALLALVITFVSPAHFFFIYPPLLLLHRAVLARQLEHAATTDDKTGLLTAAAWHQRATTQLQRVVRRDLSAAVLVIDLDNFKQVNDTHGHLAGDTVLAAIGAALRELVRSEDMVGRFGGDEFVVLLTREGDHMADRSHVFGLAERIRTGIASIRPTLTTPDGLLTLTNLSVSIGAAVYPEDGREVMDLLATADRALLSAKSAGRNRVLVHPIAPVTEVDIPAQSSQD